MERHLIAVTEIPGRLRGWNLLLFVIILFVATNWKAPFSFLMGRANNPLWWCHMRERRGGGSGGHTRYLQCGVDQTNGGGSV